MNKENGSQNKNKIEIINTVRVTEVSQQTTITSSSEVINNAGKNIEIKPEAPLFLSHKTKKEITNETAERWLKRIRKERNQVIKAQKMNLLQKVHDQLASFAKAETTKAKTREDEAKAQEIINKNTNISAKGGESNMKENQTDAQPVTFPTVEAKDKPTFVIVDNQLEKDNKTAEKVENKAVTSTKTAETKEKAPKKSMSKKQKNLIRNIGIGLTTAAIVGLAGWGIQEATENDTTDISNTHVMDAGETFEVSPNSMVSGDISINGVRYFDDSPNTGLIVEFQKGAKVTAPYGATVKENIANQGLMDEIVKEIKGQTNILHPEITEIDTIVFPGGNPQGK
jgi:hypothetical protein